VLHLDHYRNFIPRRPRIVRSGGMQAQDGKSDFYLPGSRLSTVARAFQELLSRLGGDRSAQARCRRTDLPDNHDLGPCNQVTGDREKSVNLACAAVADGRWGVKNSIDKRLPRTRHRGDSTATRPDLPGEAKLAVIDRAE